MNDERDRFSGFLKSNRPLAPEAPTGERQAIWARLGKRSYYSLPTRPVLWRFVAAAAVVLVVFAFTLRTVNRPVEGFADEAVLSDALQLSFLDDDEAEDLFSFNSVME